MDKYIQKYRLLFNNIRLRLLNIINNYVYIDLFYRFILENINIINIDPPCKYYDQCEFIIQRDENTYLKLLCYLHYRNLGITFSIVSYGNGRNIYECYINKKYECKRQIRILDKFIYKVNRYINRLDI